MKAKGEFSSLRSVTEERDWKIRTLFVDSTQTEVDAFFGSLHRHGFTRGQVQKLSEALEFTLGQDYGPRDLDRYYGTHPIRVARFIALWVKPGSPLAFEAILTALIHNVLEKDVISQSELVLGYGEWVAQAVGALTQNRALMRTEEGKKLYYARLAGMDPEVRALKFFDKFDNVFAVCLNPDADARSAYLQEIGEYVQPIGDLLVPELSGYFAEMIRDARELGYYRPTFKPL